ncbi:MAG: Formate hydrogenlyase transcriptional activator [Syntrophorhabdaceae bacterium PtaU1.Bin034]|nr:MAG: Formate hydrogenlyase transcriptional activator [Syntrophorhabdaceae bacterium PtaU1.Bin034]
MTRAVRYIADFIPLDEMYIGVYHRNKEEHRVVARSTYSEGELLNYIRRDIPKRVLQAMRDFDEHVDKQRAYIVNDPSSELPIRFLYPFVEYGTYSCLMMPLSVEDYLIGVVLLFAHGRDRYVREHAELLEKVAQPFTIALSNTLEHLELMSLKRQLEDENRCLRKERSAAKKAEIVRKFNSLRSAMELAELAAPLTNPVLILGETGTGKEVIAYAIHQMSPRKDEPLIAVNCGAIPPTLLDSELFGHEKGAFTGATANKRGCFEQAQHGTIFLDEIGELAADAQVRLLRVIQEKEIVRVGGETRIPLDVRIICATNCDLEAMVSEGRFRQDLFFRINVFPIWIPPIRERRDDIPLLVKEFLVLKAAEMGRTAPSINDRDMQLLVNYDWPGNVRELQNIIERAIILSKNDMIEIAPLLLPSKDNKTNYSREERFVRLDECINNTILSALKKTNGRINGPNGAAVLLGINPSTLRNKMKKLGIK